MLIFGALLYATIFGNVTTIIQQIYAGTFIAGESNLSSEYMVNAISSF